MKVVGYEFVAWLNMSTFRTLDTVIHTRHIVEGIAYDSSIYISSVTQDCDPEQVILHVTQLANIQVDYVVRSTRDMRIL